MYLVCVGRLKLTTRNTIYMLYLVSLLYLLNCQTVLVKYSDQKHLSCVIWIFFVDSTTLSKLDAFSPRSYSWSVTSNLLSSSIGSYENCIFFHSKKRFFFSTFSSNTIDFEFVFKIQFLKNLYTIFSSFFKYVNFLVNILIINCIFLIGWVNIGSINKVFYMSSWLITRRFISYRFFSDAPQNQTFSSIYVHKILNDLLHRPNFLLVYIDGKGILSLLQHAHWLICGSTR